MEQEVIQEKKWVRIANTVVGWFGIAIMAGLLVATAGVDLYRNHFNVLVTFLCAIPVCVFINWRLKRWAQRVEAERLKTKASGASEPPILTQPSLGQISAIQVSSTPFQPSKARILSRRKHIKRRDLVRISNINRD